MMEVVIIGAGVIGASVAYRSAQAGARVTVLEADRVGGGTSGASFAWTNSVNKVPRAYHDLNVAGMQAHADLGNEFGGTRWWHGGGRIEWVAEPEAVAQRERVNRLLDWGYAVEWISRTQIAELEPDIDLANIGDAAVAFYPQDGWLDPVVYAHAMLSAACRLGSKLHCGTRVMTIETTAGRVTGVRTADGQLYPADSVINCAGRRVNDPVLDGGLHLPTAPTVGMLVFTPPVACGLQRVVGSPLVNVRPDGAGRLLLHNDEIDATIAVDRRPDPAMPEAHALMGRVTRVFPGIGSAAPEAVRITQRPIPRDGLSAVGPLPHVDGYYLVVTHSGVTLGPLLGAAVADEVVHGRERPELAPFRPGRFFN
jgi:glycine/D-amino acid oxidase-like deaminating enzyme